MDGESLAAVIRDAQRGDPKAFDALADLYAGRIFGFVYRLTGSRHDAEDLMQEVFLRVVRTIERYKHDGRFEPWIFRIAANLVRDRVRRVKRSPRRAAPADPRGDESSASDMLDDFPTRQRTVEDALVCSEDIAEMNAALATLPEGEREVLMLRHFSQMTFKEIAELMETPLGTALARAHRGLSRLREAMTGASATKQPGGAVKMDVRPVAGEA
ncbi:MAG: sigma-70 family RNA polymerase sigma factor [Planctomycetota bacterium]|nr:sigma-70 family RNA polymerase sigma factor [Planctomycetota bacterium]